MKETLEQLMELMGDDFKQLLDVYRNDTQARLDTIREAIDLGDLDGVKKLAHTMKGSSRNMGAMDLASICEECERMIGQVGREYLISLHERASQEFEDVCKIIDAIKPEA